MTTTLSNGVKVPDVGSTNWASDLETNWTLLNACIGDIGSNVQLNRANTWTATQTFNEPIVGALTGTATMAGSDASGNDIQTTYATKTELATKQDALTASQLNAVNSGITSALVTQIGTNQSDIATKANDADAVHLAGAETVTGAKTFTASNITVANSTNTALLYRIAFEGWTFGATPASSLTGSFRTIDSAGAIVSDIMAQILASGVNQTVLRTRNTDGTNTYDRRVQLTVAQNGDTALAMSANAVADLGTSANKWKTLNGINPGALGMPNFSAIVDISGVITDTSGGNNPYAPAVNGWISITGGGTMSAWGTSSAFGVKAQDNIMMPVMAGETYWLVVSQAPIYARFYPCLGNV